MKLPSRKSKVESLLDDAGNTVADGVKKAGMPTLLVAAGVVGVAALNAVVSSLRKH